MPEEYFLQLVEPRVAPAARPWESGLPLEDGQSLPFVVERGWVGPAGTYIEEWSIRQGDRVLYRHPAHYIEVRGFQSVRRFSDTVRTPLPLDPGVYDITFVVEGYRMGSFAVQVGPVGEGAEATAAAPEPAAVATAPIPASPAPPPTPTPAPAAPAPGRPAPAAAPVAYTGEDPAAVRKRVYEEELAKGADPRVAEGRAKSAEIKAKRAAAAAAAPPPEPAPPGPAAAPGPSAAPAEAPAAAPPAPVPAEPAAPQASAAADGSPAAAASPLLPGAPDGGGGMSASDASAVRAMIIAQEAEKGTRPAVAEALADAAEIRAQRGPWWRPDW